MAAKVAFLHQSVGHIHSVCRQAFFYTESQAEVLLPVELTFFLSFLSEGAGICDLIIIRWQLKHFFLASLGTLTEG